MEGKARRDENYVEPQNQNEINCSYIKKFPLCFWIITINCVTIYSCIFPFANISNDFFISKYGFSLKQASKCTSTVFIIAAFSCSIFGIVSDKIGKRVTFIILASLLLLVSHVLFLTLASCVQCYEGLIPMIMIGVSYSIYGAALWPTIPIVVKEEYLGTAFGVTIAIQNAGLAFGPNIIGLIQIFFEGYSLVSIFFIVVSIIGLMSGMLLYYVNMRDHNNILQKPTKEIYQEENSD